MKMCSTDCVIYAIGVSLLGLDTTQFGRLTVFWGIVISV